MNNLGVSNNLNSDRIELILSNVTVGILSRVKVNLDKHLKVGDFTFKMESKSVIINNIEILEEAEKIIKSVDDKIESRLR